MNDNKCRYGNGRALRVTEMNNSQKSAIDILKETSRTFFIPISLLSPGLKEAVASAYLCMRAIDEIEDHPNLQPSVKNELLLSISQMLKKPFDEKKWNDLFEPYKGELPEVTLRLNDWIAYCPEGVLDQILDATAEMAEGMAKWALKEWKIQSENDLDEYTYYVAGLVGVMLTDIWKWYDNTEADRDLAIAFGRGLQSVNILRNISEDKTRGVNFFPENWKFDDMLQYAIRNLEQANRYVKGIDTKTILHFCQIPLTLAFGTLEALTTGKEKLSRADVTKMVSQIVG